MDARHKMKRETAGSIFYKLNFHLLFYLLDSHGPTSFSCDLVQV